MSVTDGDSSGISNEPTEFEGDDPLIGETIGRYSIVARVAKGGTATVYKAHDKVLNREVAFKILHEHLESRSEVVERFKNEAQTVASLRHPNILNVYDFFTADGRTVLVAEFMPGITLSALIKRAQRIPEDYVMMIGCDMLNGLAMAHEKGVFHRDIKPANILIHPDLGVKVSDFGLAKLINSDDGLTKEGVFIGTPSFSSPEQIEGKKLDQRTDIFSMGLVLYMMATGKHAFKQKGDSTTTVWFKIVRGKFEGVREQDPSISMDFDRILNKCLQVDPAKRYGSAREVADELAYLLKRRKLLPYNEELKKYLREPFGLGALALRKKLPLKAALLVGSLVLLGSLFLAGGFYWETIQAYLRPQTAGPSTLTETQEPNQIQAPEVAEEPPLIDDVPKVKIPDNKPAVERKVPERKRPVAPAKVFGSKKIPSLVVVDDLRLVFQPGDSGFGLRFKWAKDASFILANNSRFRNPLVDRRFDDQTFDWEDWKAGSFFWRAGQQNGKLDLESFDAYRTRTQISKADLSVSSAFEEVDLQINPWTQQLRLSWESGPQADTYQVELARDQAFKDVLFAGSVATKSSVVERLWEKDQSIFWRVRYLDQSRNVFFIDPIRKINLNLVSFSPHFDMIEPRAFDTPSANGVEIKAIGPRNSSMSCAELTQTGAPSSWQKLSKDSGFFTGTLAGKPSRIICEAKMSGKPSTFFAIPLQP